MKPLILKIWNLIRAIFTFRSKKINNYAIEDDISDWRLTDMMILREINKYRKEMGVRLLVPEENNRAESIIRVDYMVEEQRMTHDDFILSKLRLEELGFKYPTEIIGSNYSTVYNLIFAWKHSPKHNRAMLGWQHKYMGVASFGSGGGSFYCVIFSR